MLAAYILPPFAVTSSSTSPGTMSGSNARYNRQAAAEDDWSHLLRQSCLGTRLTAHGRQAAGGISSASLSQCCCGGAQLPTGHQQRCRPPQRTLRLRSCSNHYPSRRGILTYSLAHEHWWPACTSGTARAHAPSARGRPSAPGRLPRARAPVRWPSACRRTATSRRPARRRPLVRGGLRLTDRDVGRGA